MNKKDLYDLAKEKLRNNRVFSPILLHAKEKKKGMDFSEKSIRSVNKKEDQSTTIRLNIIVPTLRNFMVFGGITTALKGFGVLCNTGDYEKRIIVTSHEKFNSSLTYKAQNFSYDSEVVFLEDVNQLDIRKNDYYFLTDWMSAYTFMDVVKWQKVKYNLENRKLIYFIQDYEPGFYPWSTQFMLAESTYRTIPEDVIAIFNSKELYTYFKDNGYKFYKELFFKPSLNDTLKKYLTQDRENGTRKKRILIYGRPNSYRNAFGLLIDSLRYWSENYSKASEWEIVSLGEIHSEIQLSNNVIVSKGKVTLDEYAQYMLSSYAGVSLMASPHPSYPPLEMSTFGVKTVTNNFCNKNMSYFNDNLVCVDCCTPENVGNQLINICEKYYSGEKAVPALNQDYLDDKQLQSAVCEAAKYLFS